MKEFLNKGRKVLFTGTPCQIEALKSFLGKDYDNLYLQDIICHGVPSPLVWDKYKEYREERASSEISRVSFRSKKDTTWSAYNVDFEFKDGSKYKINHNDDIYMKAFLKHLSLRESCTDCKFKKNNRLSDITLADFWGIKNVKPEMDDGKGTSLVIVNSKRGQELLSRINDYMICEEVDFSRAIAGNPSYNTTSKANLNSDKFFSELKDGEDFEMLVKKYIPKTSKLTKIERKIKNIFKKMIK